VNLGNATQRLDQAVENDDYALIRLTGADAVNVSNEINRRRTFLHISSN
jgi:hypothetical protein